MDLGHACRTFKKTSRAKTHGFPYQLLTWLLEPGSDVAIDEEERREVNTIDSLQDLTDRSVFTEFHRMLLYIPR